MLIPKRREDNSTADGVWVVQERLVVFLLQTRSFFTIVCQIVSGGTLEKEQKGRGGLGPV